MTPAEGIGLVRRIRYPMASVRWSERNGTTRCAR